MIHFSETMNDAVIGMKLYADRLFQLASSAGADVAGTEAADSFTRLGNVTFADLQAGNDYLHATGHTGLMDMGPGDDFAVVHSAGVVRLGEGADTFTAHSTVSYVSGDDGADTINLAGGGIADGGPGNDTILAQGEFTAKGGAGQDTFKVFLTGTDAPTAHTNTVSGNQGFDTLEIIVSNGTHTAGLIPASTSAADAAAAIDPRLAADAAHAMTHGAGTLHGLALHLTSIEQITIVIDGARHLF